jgi:16S rRNA A1518/A1519 N6-dimethyltransferase RsmA/KsgA/DIM1 with predicted DNA glycosylase/AP lyase activity
LLAQGVKRVIAVERDERAIPALKKSNSAIPAV